MHANRFKPTRRSLGVGALAVAAALVRPARSPAATGYDVVVYGATPSGILAADAATRLGARVVVVEPTGHVGGALAQAGVCPLDLWTPGNIGGRTWTWLQDVAKAQGITSTDTASNAVITPAYLHAPSSVYEKVLTSWLARTGATVMLNTPLATTGGITTGAVQVSGHRITGLATAHGVVTGTMFVDASYEGDLLAGTSAAGITVHAIGRESSTLYGESLAGVGATKTFADAGLAVLSGGAPVAPLVAAPKAAVGAGDGLVMPSEIRPLLTVGGIAVTAPAGYSRASYVLPLQVAQAAGVTTLAGMSRLFTLNAAKYDLDGGTLALGFTLPNADTAYVDATPTQRAAILQRHLAWVRGLLYFLAHDTAVPAALAADVRRYGLASDEFTDNGHWPRQLYVRETRRLVGAKVMTQADLSPSSTKTTPICLGSYVIDAKPARTFAIDAHTIGWEGGLYNTATASWQIPLTSLIPNVGSCQNLIVPVCCSTSHVAWSATRLEPTFMMQGEAAGTLAALAVQGGNSVQGVAYAKVQSALLAAGAKLS